MPEAHAAIEHSTLDALQTLVRQSADVSYYIGSCPARPHHYRIWGDVTDTHYETALYAQLFFKEDHLHIELEDCDYRDFEYANPDFLPLVLGLLHPGSRLIRLSR